MARRAADLSDLVAKPGQGRALSPEILTEPDTLPPTLNEDAAKLVAAVEGVKAEIDQPPLIPERKERQDRIAVNIRIKAENYRGLKRMMFYKEATAQSIIDDALEAYLDAWHQNWRNLVP